MVRKIFAIYGLSLFGLALFILLPWLVYHFIFYKNDVIKMKRVLHFLYKKLAGFVCFACGVKVHTHLDSPDYPDKTYIVISNHKSMFDMPANAVSTPIIFKFLGKRDVKSIPLVGYISDNIGILVQRESAVSRHKSMLRMREEIRKGFSMFLYAEGTRNKTNDYVLPFKDGAFRLAIELQQPILVNTLVDTGKIIAPNKILDLAPGHVHSYWSTPIDTAGCTVQDMDYLKQKVAQIMIQNLKKHENV